MVRTATFFVLFLGVCITTNVHAQLFQQQYSNNLTTFSNTNSTDPNYVSASSPANYQVTWLSSNNAAATIGVAGGVLSMNRPGAGTLYMVRNANFSGSPTSLMVRMDYNPTSSSGTSSSASTWYLGQGYANSNSTPSTNHSTFILAISSTSGPQWKVNNTGTAYTGSKTVLWVVNNSGGILSYKAPNGTYESVANDAFDIWVGTTKEQNDVAAAGAANALNNFAYRVGGGNTVHTFDNVLIDPVPSVPTSNAATSVTSSSFTANWTAVSGVTGYRLDVATDAGFTSFVTGFNNLYVSGQATNFYDVTGLAQNTQYYYRVRAVAQYTIDEFCGGNSSDQTVTTLAGGFATVNTTAISSIGSTTASGGGNITADGGNAVTDRGVCWSTSHNPTTVDNHTSDGSGIGSFTSSLSGLTPGTLYYVRAFATNSAGTAYGSEVSFTTLASPTVTTSAISNISGTTAGGGGNVTADGGATVTARGVCWNTSGNPTTADALTTDGSGTGSFTSSLTGLTPGTTYYVKAYATNSVGTSYGGEVSFTTLAAYYNLPSSDVTDVNNWGTNTNGTGSHPADFTSNSVTYNIVNTGSTMSAAWTVSGTNSKVVLGDGTNAVSFIVPSGFAMSGTIDVANNATLTLQNTTLPTLGLLDAGSSLEFDGAATFAIPAANYGNLSSTNDAGGARTLASGTIGIAGLFTPGSASYTVTGSTVNFNGSSAQTIPTFTFNNVSFNNNCTIPNGNTVTVPAGVTAVVVGSGKTLTINGTFTNAVVGNPYTVNGTIIFGATGVYNLTTVPGGLSAVAQVPTATWQAGSTFKIAIGASTAGDYIGLTGIRQTFSNVIIDCPNFDGKILLTRQGGTSSPFMDIAGNFTVENTGTFTGVQLLSTGNNNNTLHVGGNYVQNGGKVHTIHNASSAATRNTTIDGNFTLNNSAEFDIANTTGTTSSNINYLNVKGDVTVNAGATLKRTNQAGTGGTTGTLIFNGTADQNFVNAGTVSGEFFNVTLNKSAGNVVLGSDLPVTGNLTFNTNGGNLVTGSNSVLLGANATISGEANANYLIGKAVMTRTLTGSHSNIGGSGISINTNSQDLGSSSILRTTGTAGRVTFNTNTGIDRKWKITPTTQPTTPVNVTLSWLSGEDNSKVLTDIYVYKSTDDGATWFDIAGPLDGSSRSLSFNTATFSEFTFTDGNNPLPVELSAFSAAVKGSTVILQWTTETEVNNSHFLLERRLQTKWETVAAITGAGNSSSQKNYSFTDTKLKTSGTYTYRLRQVDNDGTVKTLRELSVEATLIPKEFALLQNYPNPFNPGTVISYQLPVEAKVRLDVFDLLGNHVAALVNEVQSAGTHEKYFDAAQLTNGIYIYQLKAGSYTYTRKMTLLK